MRLWVWSDLHLEAQKAMMPSAAPAGADAIVCAGDLCAAADLARIARRVIERYRLPMVCVPGNHEFFTPAAGGVAGVEECRAAIARAAEASMDWPARLYVLDDAAAVIGGVRFVGGTLWTDFALGAEPGDMPWRMNDALAMAPDFARIFMEAGKRISPQDMLRMHAATRRFIEGELAVPFAGPTVVMTHHMPHPDCTPAGHRQSPASFLYASSEAAFGGLLESEKAPALWVCGHTHHAFDLHVGRTRILCNPLGYLDAADERENGFRWDLVAEA